MKAEAIRLAAVSHAAVEKVLELQEMFEEADEDSSGALDRNSLAQLCRTRCDHPHSNANKCVLFLCRKELTVTIKKFNKKSGLKQSKNDIIKVVDREMEAYAAPGEKVKSHCNGAGAVL